MKNNFYILVIFILAFSCKEKDRSFDQGYGYYPLAIGNYKVYKVDITKIEATVSTSESFYIKEKITDTFTVSSELKYVLYRYKSADSLNWPETPDSVWTASVYPNKAIKVENNVRYIKLVFPVENAKTWNGNGENNQGSDEYKYQNVGKPYTLKNTLFSNTVTVSQQDESSAVNKNFCQEVYAKDIGMIYKVQEIYFYLQNNGIPQTGTIDNGIKYYERMIRYGKE